MPDRVYLDWNATTPLRREAREAMARRWTLPRQSLVGPRRGPPGPPAGRGGEGSDRRRRRRAAARRRLYVRRNRGQCAGADAGAAARLHASGSKAGCLGDRARLGAGGRTVSRRRDRDRRRNAVPAWWIWTVCARRLRAGSPALVSVMLANNETGALQPVAEAGRNRPCRGRPAACRCDPGASEKYHLISIC